ncbi:MAG: restriction endonuclease subunit S [Microcystis aeruginosa]
MKEKTINLPELWMTKKLGDLCDIARGGSPRPIQQYLTNSPDGINWIKISDASASSKYIYETKEKIKPEGVTKSRLVQKDDFLLSNSMSFGRPYIMKTSGCIHDGWLVLKDKSGLFDQDYLYYFLNSQAAYKQFDNLAAGSTVRNLNTQLVKNVIIPIPPIEEQKRIVEILDKAFEGIAQAEANTRRNLINARELFDSYIARVFSCKKDNWLETTLGDSCFFFNGKAHEKNIDKYGKFIVVNSKFISSNGSIEKRTNLDLFPLLINDIVMVMSDVPKGKALGKCYLIEQNNKYSLNQRICAIRSNKFNSLFLYYQLNRNYYFLKFDNQENQTNLRKDDILKCPLYLPPIDEQKEIASDLTQFKENGLALETIYQRKLEAIAELKQSILEKAFTGQLSQ